MSNRIRRVAYGAKLLSYCCSAVLVFFVVVIINMFITLFADYSVLDRSPTTPVLDVLFNLVLLTYFLAVLAGVWMVTAGDERIKSLALLNINRLLARGFTVLAMMIWMLMILNDLLSMSFGAQPLWDASGEVANSLSVYLMMFQFPWAGFLALHYAWLYYELGIYSREKARRFGILIILGAVASILLWLEHIGALSLVLESVPTSLPSSFVSFVLNLIVMWAGFAAFVYIIQMPYLMKPAAVENDPAT